jgi:hypothetical protein
MLNTIRARIKSSTLFSQEKFDEKSEKWAVGTHYKHIVLAAFLVGLCALSLMALTAPKYWTARSLLARGMPTPATVDNVDVKELLGRGERFITTVDYRFRVADETFRGTSTKNSTRPERVSKGEVIEVLYDPTQPSVNGWRPALTRETAGVFGVLAASALILPYCALSSYRYVQWIRRRRKSRATTRQNRAVR